MVVHLYTHVTISTVEWPWRAHYLASIAVGKKFATRWCLVSLLLGELDILKFIEAEKSLSRVHLSYLRWLFCSVLNKVCSVVVNYLWSYSWYDSWFSVTAQNVKSQCVNHEWKIHQTNNDRSNPSAKRIVSKENIRLCYLLTQKLERRTQVSLSSSKSQT